MKPFIIIPRGRRGYAMLLDWELDEILTKAYEQGKADGKAEYIANQPVIIPSISPYITWTPETKTTCSNAETAKTYSGGKNCRIEA